MIRVGSPRANPIVAREVKERMRTLRAPVVLTVYLLILGLLVFAAERVFSRDAAFNPGAAAGLGRAVFHFLLFFTLMLVCFLVPGFTASSIAGERERQTFPLLQVTLLRPRSIVLGKLASSLAYLLLLVLATLPLISVSFILGGVSPLEVLKGYGMVILTGFTLAMIGIALSAIMRRTVSATVLAYALVGVLVIGTVISYGLARVIVERSGRDPGRHVWTLVANPFVGTASAIAGGGATGGPSTPFTSLFDLITTDIVTGADGLVVPRPEEVVVRRGLKPHLDVIPNPFIAAAPSEPHARLPVWASTVAWYLGISAAAYLLALRGVRAPAKGPRARRRAEA